MIPVSQREIARYLGYQGIQPDEKVQQVIDSVVDELQKKVAPRFIHREENLTLAEGVLHLGPIETPSKDLAKNLQDCEKVLLVGATLGPEPDYMVMRYEKFDVLRSAITQAAAAALIEGFLDTRQEELRISYEKQGLYMRPRFSPGYGDLPLSLQPDFLNVLQMPKFLGVTLTDGMLMMPSKSVTAVIGLSRKPYLCQEEDSCNLCGMESCPYRK